MDTGNHTANEMKGVVKAGKNFYCHCREKEKEKITIGKMPNQPLPLNDFRVMIRKIPKTQEWKKGI